MHNLCQVLQYRVSLSEENSFQIFPNTQWWIQGGFNCWVELFLAAKLKSFENIRESHNHQYVQAKIMF